jgi:hypothetical protein
MVLDRAVATVRGGKKDRRVGDPRVGDAERATAAGVASARPSPGTTCALPFATAVRRTVGTDDGPF